MVQNLFLRQIARKNSLRDWKYRPQAAEIAYFQRATLLDKTFRFHIVRSTSYLRQYIREVFERVKMAHQKPTAMTFGRNTTSKQRHGSEGFEVNITMI